MQEPIQAQVCRRLFQTGAARIHDGMVCLAFCRVQGVLDRVGAGSFAQAFELRRRAVHDGVGGAHLCCGDSRSALIVFPSDFSSSAMRRSAESNAFSDSSMEPAASASVPMSCGPSCPGSSSAAAATWASRASRRLSSRDGNPGDPGRSGGGAGGRSRSSCGSVFSARLSVPLFLSTTTFCPSRAVNEPGIPLRPSRLGRLRLRRLTISVLSATIRRTGAGARLPGAESSASPRRQGGRDAAPGSPEPSRRPRTQGPARPT